MVLGDPCERVPKGIATYRLRATVLTDWGLVWPKFSQKFLSWKSFQL